MAELEGGKGMHTRKDIRLPLNPRRPERVCWGCDKYCPADDLACGNGTIRTPHPAELFGEDWLEFRVRSLERRDRSSEKLDAVERDGVRNRLDVAPDRNRRAECTE